METSYHFQNIDSSDALKEYADKVVDKLSGHFSNLQNATVHFKVERIHQIAEITINGDNGQFVAEEKAEDMYAALDLVEKKLERQIKKHKEKHLGKNQRA